MEDSPIVEATKEWTEGSQHFTVGKNFGREVWLEPSILGGNPALSPFKWPLDQLWI